ncbi:hypothetical protein KIPB_010290, partial [Kipferlia bialata]
FTSILFPEPTVKQFLVHSGLKNIIRSHSCIPSGYMEMHQGLTATLFSVPNYCEEDDASYCVVMHTPGGVLRVPVRFNCSAYSAIMNQPLCQPPAPIDADEFGDAEWDQMLAEAETRDPWDTKDTYGEEAYQEAGPLYQTPEYDSLGGLNVDDIVFCCPRKIPGLLPMNERVIMPEEDQEPNQSVFNLEPIPLDEDGLVPIPDNLDVASLLHVFKALAEGMELPGLAMTFCFPTVRTQLKLSAPSGPSPDAQPINRDLTDDEFSACQDYVGGGSPFPPTLLALAIDYAVQHSIRQKEIGKR